MLKANMMYINDEVFPSWSSCYRCVADFYSIELSENKNKIINSPNRKVIRYYERNKLNWSDFEITIHDSSYIPFQFISNIQLYSSGRTFWTGEFKDIKAQGVFYSDVSAFNKLISNSNNLEAICILFDISQLYAKKLERHLNSDNLKPKNISTIQKVLEEYLNNMLIAQKEFIEETYYGYKSTELKRWTDIIKKELEEYK